jgi:beta-N-acetylhexosaminidase
VTGVLLLGAGWSVAETSRASATVAKQAASQPVAPYIAADQEGGTVQHLSGAGFSDVPSAATQGTWTPQRLTAQAAQWAQQLHSAGVSLDLAPVADTVPATMIHANQPIGSLNRAFSSDPATNGTQAAAFIAGMGSSGVQACVKHFPGLGRVTGNTDYTTSGIVDDTTTRHDPYLDAFAQAIAAKPTMVMVSLATYTQLDRHHQAVFSPAIITQILRGDLGWQGVVITDSLGAAATANIPASQSAADFIAAGGDIAIFTSVDDIRDAHDGLRKRMAADPAFAAQIDASVLRVLTAKQAAGLLQA